MKSKIFFVLALTSISMISSGCYKQDHELLRPKVQSEATTIEENYNTKLIVADKNILVEVVNNDVNRQQGLSYRKNLLDKNGMLFDFTNTNTRTPSFWMKDMNFDIDIIWINKDKIIGITSNVPAPKNNSPLPTYSPPSEITHVLEVNSGWSDRNNIKIGDQIKIQS